MIVDNTRYVILYCKFNSASIIVWTLSIYNRYSKIELKLYYQNVDKTMERRITSKVEKHQLSFKESIRSWFEENDCRIVKSDNDMTSEFLKFVFDYGALSFEAEDFQKRKRVKNVISHFERCTANRANGEQCTRRRQDGSCFCGTHAKGTPHGISKIGQCDTNGNSTIKKIEVWVEEINGINYYIDSENNVYRAEDIVENKQTPAIIAKWKLGANNSYTIPEFDALNTKQSM